MSGPEYDADVQETMPETVSEPENATLSGRLYQPRLSGSRPGTPLTVGAVASNLNTDDATAALLLPALSRHLPDAVAEPLSGPAYGTESHELAPTLGRYP